VVIFVPLLWVLILRLLVPKLFRLRLNAKNKILLSSLKYRRRFLITCAALYSNFCPFDRENFVMISLTVHGLSCWLANRRSNKQTNRLSHRHYWKQYHPRCAGGKVQLTSFFSEEYQINAPMLGSNASSWLTRTEYGGSCPCIKAGLNELVWNNGVRCCVLSLIQSFEGVYMCKKTDSLGDVMVMLVNADVSLSPLSYSPLSIRYYLLIHSGPSTSTPIVGLHTMYRARQKIIIP